MSITKRDLVKRVAQSTGLSERKVGETVQCFLDEVIEVLAEHERLELRNFGVFTVIKHKEKTILHPVTGKPVLIPSHKVLSFEAGKHVKERLGADLT